MLFDLFLHRYVKLLEVLSWFQNKLLLLILLLVFLFFVLLFYFFLLLEIALILLLSHPHFDSLITCIHLRSALHFLRGLLLPLIALFSHEVVLLYYL